MSDHEERAEDGRRDRALLRVRAAEIFKEITDKERMAWIHIQEEPTFTDTRFYHICSGPRFRGLCRDNIDEAIVRERLS